MTYRGGATEEEILRQLRDYGQLRIRSLSNLTSTPSRELRPLLKNLEDQGKIRKSKLYPRCREILWEISQ